MAMMQVTHKGARSSTRGWSSSKWVKKITSRSTRRAAKVALMSGKDTESYKRRLGYCW